MMNDSLLTWTGFNPPATPLDLALAAESAGGHATLVVNRVGRIRNCGSRAGGLFVSSPLQLIGKRLSDLIKGFLDGSSPSYNARYLVHLCANVEWRRFEATDLPGRNFPVDLKLSRVTAEGEDFYVVNLRSPGVQERH